MRHGLQPNLVTVGKPMGNGQPIAAVVTDPAIVAEFGRKARYFNTFGGNPVSCAAAMAVLQVIERDRLVENAARVGAYVMGGLRRMAERYEAIGDVRGAGLFVGLELVSDRVRKRPDAAITAKVVNGLRQRRVLISACGPYANALKIRPPLVFSRQNADTFIGALDEVLHGIAL
jgi:4-aminobutyrate aminotransferase-like enzyme